MNNNDFASFINTIKVRAPYKAHAVLDRGQEIVLVHITTGLWFLFSTATWKEITEEEARRIASSYYFPDTIDQMIGI